MDDLIDLVVEGRKYRAIDRGLIAGIAAEEVGRPGDLVRAIRRRLHRAVCAYQIGKPRFERWLESLRDAAGEPARLKAVCRDAMRWHSSTAERLPILDRFYRSVLPAGTASVVDVGCGMNPLAIPWMGLASGAHYWAYDADGALVAFLDRALPLLGVDGRAEVRDVASEPDTIERGAEVALVLKLLPLLSDGGYALVGALEARTLVVSFPTRTLGGGKKGFGRAYEARYGELFGGRRVELPGELALVIERSRPPLIHQAFGPE